MEEKQWVLGASRLRSAHFEPQGRPALIRAGLTNEVRELCVLDILDDVEKLTLLALVEAFLYLVE